ncbi:hypothetical protein AB0L06_32600 [Spirillospora sp. NPDC052269]
MARRSAVLFGALAAAALAQAVSVAGPAQAEQAPKGEATICDQMDIQLPNILGQHCDTRRRGGLRDFLITYRDDRQQRFLCHTGRADGSLWVRGQNCRPSPQHG